MTDDDQTSRLDARLDRLEQKLDASLAGIQERFEHKFDASVAGLHTRLDALAEALTAIRLLEERVGQNSRSLERAFQKLELHEADIEQLKEQRAGTMIRLDFGERVFWIAATAAVGYYFHTFGGAG